MNLIKALYRGWSIPCAGTQVYAPRYHEEWLHKIEHVGARRRANLLYQQLDGLQMLRQSLRRELLAESRKHKATKLLRQIPCIGPIRAARLIALAAAFPLADATERKRADSNFTAQSVDCAYPTSYRCQSSVRKH